MNILIVGDIHNDIENIIKYSDKLSLLNFDVVVCPGDFTDYNLPRGFSATDIGRIILEELRAFKKPILAIPGNFDKELISLFEKENVSIHGRGQVIGNVGFYGFGGARTPFNTPLEPSESEIKNGLETALIEIKKAKIKIQITHAPPANTKMDTIYTGAHVGSEVVRKFIEKEKPEAAVSAHIHEARGIDELNGTKLINAGRFPEGYCGLITIKNSNTTTKIINLI